MYLCIKMSTYYSSIKMISFAFSQTSCRFITRGQALANSSTAISCRISARQSCPLLLFFKNFAAYSWPVDFDIHCLTTANFPLRVEENKDNFNISIENNVSIIKFYYMFNLKSMPLNISTIRNLFFSQNNLSYIYFYNLKKVYM